MHVHCDGWKAVVVENHTSVKKIVFEVRIAFKV